MEEDVETRRDVDCTRAGVGVERVDDTEERAQEAVGDSCLRRKWAVVENGSSSGLSMQEVSSKREGRGEQTHLGSSSSGRGDSDEGAESTGDGESLSDGSVDKVKKLGVRVAGEEVGDFLRRRKPYE